VGEIADDVVGDMFDEMLEDEDGESAWSKRESDAPPDSVIDANLDRNHNLLCGCATPYEGKCALA
jgi:hypothetical protein